jgi:hypothetical protein
MLLYVVVGELSSVGVHSSLSPVAKEAAKAAAIAGGASSSFVSHHQHQQLNAVVA